MMIKEQHKICDECETVAHCTKHGCIPKVSAKDAMKLALDHLMNLQPILGNGLLEERQLAFIDPHIDCAIAALQGGLAEQPSQPQEPIYQYQMTNGSWIDQTKESHDYNVRHGQATVRVVYTSPQPAQQQEPVAWRELCRRLYVELFHCDWQMTAAWDEEGGPMWQQGATVRDVLADAKAALETSPPAQRKPHDCARSHPHENMDAICELRTEIARLTNENARLKAQPQQEPQTSAQERTEFEQFWVDELGEAYELTYGKLGYAIRRVDIAWEAWKAGKISANQQTIVGRKVWIDWKAQALELRELVRLNGIKIAELESAQPAQQEPVAAAKKDAVFAASIEFIGALTGMQPPPIEVAPPEILKPFRDFTEKVCSIFVAPQPAPVQQFDHTAAANAALRDAQNRSYQVAKSTLPAPVQQEPVAWRWSESNGQRWFDWTTDWSHHDKAKSMGVPIEYAYTFPPARKPLTDDEILAIGKELGLKCRLGGNSNIDFDYARAIEAAHGIKGDA